MTSNDTTVAALLEQLIEDGPQAMAQVMTALMNVAMKLEREQFLGAAHYERDPGRRGYANGFKSKKIDTQAGTLRLDIPKTAGTPEPFYPGSLERGRRSCRAVMLAAAEMYVKGVSTRDVEKVLKEFGISGALPHGALLERMRAFRRRRSPAPRRCSTPVWRPGASARSGISATSSSTPATRRPASTVWPMTRRF
jgi:transposase-like protein